MRNRVYWNRLYLQEQRRRYRRPTSAVACWNGRWLNLNANLNFCLVGWVHPIIVNQHRLRLVERKKLKRGILAALAKSDDIEASIEAATQRELNALATRIRQLSEFCFELTIKYHLFEKGQPELTEALYDTAAKEFVLRYKGGRDRRQYFLGRLQEHQLSEAMTVNKKSHKEIRAVFGSSNPADQIELSPD